MKKRSLKKLWLVIIFLSLIFVVLKLSHPLIKKEEISLDIKLEEEEIKERKNISNYDAVSILKYDYGTIKKRLKDLSKDNNAIKEILKDSSKYPNSLLEALSYNPELASFVLDYPQKKNKYYSDNVGELKEEVPILFQWDKRWGYYKYGNSNIAVSGCGPTALSMVVTYLTQNNTYTPVKIAQFAEANGYYLESSGTTWDLMRKGSKHFGVKVKELSLDKNIIFKALKNKHPIIASMRKGDFTLNGHYIVLVGVEDGKIKINDPNSKIRSAVLWDYERIKNQIKNLWEFYI